MAVRAKFQVWNVKQSLDRDGNAGSVEVELGAVTSGSDENKAFWQYTPSGKVTMTITNPDAYKHFLPGQQFYLDFTPAE